MPSTEPEAPSGALRPAGRTSLVRSGAVYATTAAAQRGVTFLLLPILTRALSPAAYGQVSIALAANAVAGVVFACGLDLTILRTAVRQSQERDRYVQSIWTFLLIAPLAAAFAVSIVAAPFLAGSDVLTSAEFALSMFAAALYVGATTLPLAVLRADERLRDFVVVNAVTTAVTAGLMVALVVGLHLGVTGWLIALVIGSAATLVASMIVVPYHRPRRWDLDVVRLALRRGLPVMPHFAAMWSLQLADRLLLAALVSTAAVGVYGLAANMALPLLVLSVGINQALMPSYARAEDSHARGRLRSLISAQIAIVCGLTLVCALFAPPAVHLLMGARFAAAAPLTPWLVLGYGFLGLYAIPMNGVTLTHGKSRRIWVLSLVAAVVNLGMIYALVPEHGVTAAAVASAVGYAVLLIGVLVYAGYTGATLPYPWRSILAIVTVCAVAYAGGVLSSSDTTLGDVLVRTAWITLAFGALFGRHALNLTGGVGSLLRTGKLRYRDL